jgi:hypothetical protein
VVEDPDPGFWKICTVGAAWNKQHNKFCDRQSLGDALAAGLTGRLHTGKRILQVQVDAR